MRWRLRQGASKKERKKEEKEKKRKKRIIDDMNPRGGTDRRNQLQEGVMCLSVGFFSSLSAWLFIHSTNLIFEHPSC
jgi:hypothetical protein